LLLYKNAGNISWLTADINISENYVKWEFKMINLSLNEQLEVIEQLLKMTTRREAEIAQLKTQLEVYQSFDVDEEVFKDDGRLGKILLLFSSRTIKDILQMMLERTGLYEVKTIDDLEDIPSAFALFSPDV